MVPINDYWYCGYMDVKRSEVGTRIKLAPQHTWSPPFLLFLSPYEYISLLLQGQLGKRESKSKSKSKRTIRRKGLMEWRGPVDAYWLFFLELRNTLCFIISPQSFSPYQLWSTLPELLYPFPPSTTSSPYFCMTNISTFKKKKDRTHGGKN